MANAKYLADILATAPVESSVFVLDSIGSTRGAILYRGASGWAIASPGTSGHVWTSNGAGADPTWQAGGSGGSPLTTKGDIYTYSTIADRLGVGADGTVLTASSGAATGLTWVAPGGIADGDKGDITVSGSGATWTIDAGAVTLAKMADIATASILGRNTAGTGSPEVLSASTTKTLLSLGNVENTALSTWAGSTAIVTLGTITTGTVPVARVSGLATVATSGSASDLGAGTLPVARIADTTLPLAKLLYATTESTIATGSYNDYAIGTADALRVQGNGGNLTFTGFVAGANGQVLSLQNFHPTNTVTLAAEDAGSSANNRIGIPTAITLAGYESVILQYEASAFTNRWRVIARAQATAGGSGLTQAQVLTRQSFGVF